MAESSSSKGALRRRDLLKAAGLAGLAASCASAAATRVERQAGGGSGASTSPPPSDPLFASATEVLAALAAGQVSSVELTRMCFERMRALDESIHAVVLQREEAALREAAAADEARRRGEGGDRPLLGLPVTLKEAFDVAGLPTTWGNPQFEGSVASEDSEAAARYRRAGAIIMGKTNVAFMLGNYDSVNPVYGRTVNPWNAERTAGGSSGGAAAALATGQTFLGVGSDIGGSIRQPAHCCGVWGHKPTAGIVSQLGHAPPVMPRSVQRIVDDELFTMGLPAAGPMARSAEDLALALSVLAGPTPPAARAMRWSMPEPRATELRKLRVGFVLDDPAGTVSTEVGDVLQALIDGLAGAGVSLREGWPGGIDPVRQRDIRHYLRANLGVPQDEESKANLDKARAALPEQGWPPGDYYAIQARALTDGLEARKEVQVERLTMRAAWEAYFADVDVFLSPVERSTAHPHDQLTLEESNGDHIWYAAGTVIGLPATVAPAGLASDGLPVGVQIHGAMYDDATPLAFGAAMTANGLVGFRKPPLS